MASSRIPLTTGGKIVAVTGVLFLLDTFAPWHRLCVGVQDVQACSTDIAWDTGFSTAAALLVALLLVEVLVEPLVAQAKRAEWAQLRLGVSGLATSLVLLQLAIGDGALGSTYGLWLGIVLSAGLTYGNYLRSSEKPAARLSLNR